MSAAEITAPHPATKSRTAQRIWLVLLITLLVALPQVAPGHWVYFAGLLGINVIATHGLNLMMGYAGLLSLGHAAFVGVGAYTAALLQIHLGLPFWITLPAAGFMSALVGGVFGLPSLRIRGLYLIVATLAAQFILHFIFVEWQPVTNGDIGLSVAAASIFGYPLNNEVRIYYLILVVATAATLFARNVVRSRVGRAFVAIRERDLTAQVLGVETVRYKFIAFALGSFYAGVAGALLAYFNRYVNPEQFTLLLSVFFLSAVIVGGMGSILGAILGATFMTLLPEILREALVPLAASFGLDLSPVMTPLREVLFGLLIVGFMLLEPRGLAHLWTRVKRSFSR